MGMVYKFSLANPKILLSAKNCDEIFNAIDFDTQIADELDREDFIGEILGTYLPEYLDGVGKEINEKKMHLLYECNLAIVSEKMVERALKILKDLDDKVFSMPWDRSIARKWCAGIGDISDEGYKHEYEEPHPSGRGYGYYGPSKEFVDIVKEVEKVYGGREYHFGYPWNVDDDENYGSYEIRRILNTVLKVMKTTSDEFVFVLRSF